MRTSDLAFGMQEKSRFPSDLLLKMMKGEHHER